MLYLCTRKEAQMAESVDALVSNTSGAIRAGSTPALGTMKSCKRYAYSFFTSIYCLFLLYFSKC